MMDRQAARALWIRRQSILILILLLATVLRFLNLGDQSFWNDEGNTARLVERPLALIIEGAAGDIHPPGYYIGLHLWRAVAGESEFALRASSALCGILTVAVVATISRIAAGGRGIGESALRQRSQGRITRVRTGGTAAVYGAVLLTAIHPLSVAYGQEARMYAQLGLATALTLWAAVALVTRAERCTGPDRAHNGTPRIHRWGLSPSRRAPLALAGAIVLGLYTQYAYVLALVGLNLAFGLYWVVRPLLLGGYSGAPQKRPRRLLLSWLLAHGVGGLAFLPWAPIALRARGWRPPDLAPGEALGAMVQTLLAGVTLPRAIPPLATWGAALLTVLALWLTLRERRRVGVSFTLWAATSMALVPPGLIAVAGIYRPAYLKFLMVSVAPLAVVLSAPLRGWLELRSGQARTERLTLRLSQAVALVLWLGLLPALGQSLHHLISDPAYQRDDYRGIAALIREEGRGGDAILLNAPNQWEVFTYYYRDPAGDRLPVYPAPYRPTSTEAERWVDDILETHSGGRLFVLYWGDVESDPERHIERLLAQRAFKARDEWITSVRLALYGTSQQADEPSVEVEALLGDGRQAESVKLVGAHLPPSPWQPGDVLPLTLFWRAEQPVEAPLKVFIHLVDDRGCLVAQTDMEPQAGFFPTWAWSPGELVIDRYGVLLPTDLGPGTYRLHVGMYHTSGERLPITVAGAPAGDTLILAQVRVGPP
jgi:mannosyltransferase